MKVNTNTQFQAGFLCDPGVEPQPCAEPDAQTAALRLLFGRRLARSLERMKDKVRACGASSEEAMPVDARIYYYECKGSRALLRPYEGDCCVFCSFGSVKCPPVLLARNCCG